MVTERQCVSRADTTSVFIGLFLILKIMKADFNKLIGWEGQKAIHLLSVAQKLKMDLNGYGELGVNQTNGNTYIWLEDYPVSLYMPIHCELTWDDVIVLWTNMDNGDEVEESLAAFNNIDDIYEWVKELEHENNLS